MAVIRRQTAVPVLLLGLTTRLVGVTVTTLTNTNTYARGDVHGFSYTAIYIADGLRQGVYILPSAYSSTYHTWGTFLAPFWLLPGPSRIYARIGIAILGTYAIYNVYIITLKYSSQQAALLAVTPLIVYPSFIMIHSTVLRETAILVGLTAATRFLVAPSSRFSTVTNSSLAIVFLGLATILRPDNFPVYIVVIILAGLLKYRHLFTRSTLRYLVPPTVIGGVLVTIPLVQRVIVSLSNLRRVRARGRTMYLDGVFPETIHSAVAFSWVGAAYFLFTPFPWMITEITDFVAFFEAIGNLIFAIFGIFGARAVIRKNVPVGVALLFGIVIGAVLYGFGTANVGTAIRHRQMVLWAIFVLGGIGISERIRFHFSFDAISSPEPPTPKDT
jgi:hypothetical protein